MKRGHTHNETRTEAGAADRDRVAARAAREEVTDILAEALWTLICTGRGPSPAPSIRSRVTSCSGDSSGREQNRQPVENTRN